MPSLATSRALAPSDFSFYGFDDLMVPVAEALREVEIRCGDPAVSIIEDGIFVPGTKLPAPERGPGRFKYQGSIVTRDGQTIEAVQARRRGTRWGDQNLGEFSEPVVTTPEREVAEEVVYLGWYFSQFGHFLLESLARSWFLEEVPPSVRVVFHTIRQPAPTGTTQRILEAFGIPLSRILVLDEPTLLRRVIVPEPRYEISCAAHERMAEPFRRVASSIVDAGAQSSQPVYLSRRLLSSSLRRIVGEHEWEEVLRENGFLIAHPETMTFEDQVRLINQHSDIFTSTGSAAYIVLFALGRPTLHVLTAGVPRTDYFLTPTVAGAAATFCNVLGRGDRPAFNQYTAPLILETPEAVEYLEARGFLSKRLRASLVGRGGEKRDTYDEAWLYVSVQDVPRGEALATEVEREALLRARTSWPLSWVLAWHYAFQDCSRLDDLALQFAELVAAETDSGRLAHYHGDVALAAQAIVNRCGAEIAARLTRVLADRFLVNTATPRPSRTGNADFRHAGA